MKPEVEGQGPPQTYPLPVRARKGRRGEEDAPGCQQGRLFFGGEATFETCNADHPPVTPPQMPPPPG